MDTKLACGLTEDFAASAEKNILNTSKMLRSLHTASSKKHFLPKN